MMRFEPKFSYIINHTKVYWPMQVQDETTVYLRYGKDTFMMLPQRVGGDSALLFQGYIPRMYCPDMVP
jgi:hypothetical protein